jgi:transposase
MPASLSLGLPKGYRIVSGRSDDQQMTVTLITPRRWALGPACQHRSRRVHSRYQRRVADLPAHGRALLRCGRARRFFCQRKPCPQRIFVERLPERVGVAARRSQRRRASLQELGFALGGRPAARMAERLGMRASPRTLIRLVMAAPDPPVNTPRALGVDDFAFKRGQRYGTILVDLERGRPVDLLPDRGAASLAQWLGTHPGGEWIARDRSGSYAAGARLGAPKAVQVADRWHLLHNLVEALQTSVARHRRWLGAVARETEPAPSSPSGLPSQASLSADARPPPRRRGGRHSTGRAWQPYLEARGRAGVHNGAQLWRELLEQGFTGAEDAVGRCLAPWRAHGVGAPTRPKGSAGRSCAGRADGVPTVRQVTWWLLEAGETPTAVQQAFVERLLARCPILAQGRRLAQEFLQLVRQRAVEQRAPWRARVPRSGPGELKRFSAGLAQDEAAVRAALESPWSNGKTEGGVNRLKVIKRQMYGRAGFELLRRRVLHAP